jgi:hypothetical protein
VIADAGRGAGVIEGDAEKTRAVFERKYILGMKKSGPDSPKGCAFRRAAAAIQPFDP